MKDYLLFFPHIFVHFVDGGGGRGTPALGTSRNGLERLNIGNLIDQLTMSLPCFFARSIDIVGYRLSVLKRSFDIVDRYNC